ncbi:PQQ-binding-like beta-propeller repeat protein [Acidiphilium multivorum]|uniref:outer membrane protein assembly factor BamB family protein n=1 Tax=Acidiphilium TaxID=522 RepID=UPI00338E4F3B
MNTDSKGPASCVVWKVNVGRIHSKNCIVVDDNRLFIGTCGQHWNVDDDEDGVVCLDAKTGSRIWFTPTGCDVNGICRAGRHLLCPTDRGSIFVLDANSGEVAGIFDLDAPALSKPLVWHQDDERWEAIAISASGTIYRLEHTLRDIQTAASLREPVRADVVDIGSPAKRAFVAVTESGLVIRCEIKENQISPRILNRLTYTTPTFSECETECKTASVIHAAPATEGNAIFVGYARNTYYSTPPLICIDAVTGKEIWRAGQLPTEHCGNCRTTPVVIGPYLIAAFAYSDSLHLFDKRTGAFLAAIRVGPLVFQQWSAPIKFGEHRILFGRIDGRLSIIDLNDKVLLAFISLAKGKLKFEPFDDLQCDRPYPLGPRRRPLGICGTPTIVEDSVFVGTTSGELFAINLRSVNDSAHSRCNSTPETDVQVERS